MTHSGVTDANFSPGAKWFILIDRYDRYIAGCAWASLPSYQLVSLAPTLHLLCAFSLLKKRICSEI